MPRSREKKTSFWLTSKARNIGDQPDVQLRDRSLDKRTAGADMKDLEKNKKKGKDRDHVCPGRE